MWFSNDGEVVIVAEGDSVSRSAITMVAMASGSFSDGESTELITMSQMTEAMEAAGTVAAKFCPPGK